MELTKFDNVRRILHVNDEVLVLKNTLIMCVAYYMYIYMLDKTL